MHLWPLLIAAIMLHHSVVLPMPPSAAIRVICPSGTHPGISHVASSSVKLSSDLKHDKNGSAAGAHCGVAAISFAISSQAFSAPALAIRWDTSPCSGIFGHTVEMSNTWTLDATPCRAAAVSWA